MHVEDAVAQRKSIRDFLDKPVSNDVITELLEQASRSPSSGNVQPWRIYVVNGESMTRFKQQQTTAEKQQPPFPMYPSPLKEPYRTARYEVGEDMYAKLDIGRDNRPARIQQVLKNYQFFGAPAALFCFFDKDMEATQWADLGMFIQTFMLLAQGKGLGTCAQGSWLNYADFVANFVGAPDNEILFCGMAIGYPNPEAAVNELASKRFSVADFAKFV